MGVHRISLVTDPVLRAVIHNAKSSRKKRARLKRKKEKRKIRGKQEGKTTINDGTASFHGGVDPLPTATTNPNAGDRRDSRIISNNNARPFNIEKGVMTGREGLDWIWEIRSREKSEKVKRKGAIEGRRALETRTL